MKSRRITLTIIAALMSLVVALGGATGCSKKTTEKKSTEKKVVKPAEPLTAEIKVDKTTAKAGEAVKYTLLVKNNTDQPMEGLKLKFANPSGLDTQMSQEGGPQPSFDQGSNTWTWEAGTVNSKGSYWFTITMQMLPGAPAGASISAQFTVEGGLLTSPVISNNATTTIS